MKYGAHNYVFIDRWSDAHIGLLDTARELGLEYWEIGVGNDVHFTPGLTRSRAEALEMDLAISPGGIWPRECDLSADDPAQRQAGLDWHMRQVDLAGDLGAVAYTGALYGHPGVLHYRRLSEDEYQHIAEGLHALAEHGARAGVEIVIEPMSHFRTHVVNTTDQAMHLAALADHPNLRILVDTYHLITEVRDYRSAIRCCGDRLWGVHACENDRGAPGGGLVPWPAVFEAFADIDFDGYVIFESYNSSLGDFASSRGMLHDVCPDGAAFVQSGLAFLKSSHAQAQRRKEH
jgi:D-psicose/D-tagatose/L-ribulose 3-epimerase